MRTLQRSFIAGAAILGAVTCSEKERPTGPVSPMRAVVQVQRTPVCHLDQETGLYTLITISNNAVPAHLKHGDEFPGGPASGSDPVETRFAVAWIDMNGDHVYQPPHLEFGADCSQVQVGDVLIAKLVDANGDGVVSVGDKVIMGRYPTNFDATAFGYFGVTEHVVTGGGALYTVIRVDVGTEEIFFINIGPIEEYVERNGRVVLSLLDNASNASGQGDRLFTQFNAFPSQPDATIDVFRSQIPSVNDGFVDVRVNPWGS